jgi:redox-sensitive bicupin YhaK (pirin superfamily)
MKRVPAASLFVSEPSPSWFGNPGNLAKSANWTNANWLKSRFHFAFAEFGGPPHHFGVLRVLNDDLVQPDRGFGAHAHKDMEIATFVLQGALTHEDSMGSKETLSRGSVQFMSAGAGVRHSEKNASPLEPLRFLQLWVVPERQGLQPNYGSYDGSTPEAQAARRDALFHVVASPKGPAPIKLSQDVNMFVAELGPGKQVNFTLRAQRQAYFVCAEGSAVLSSSRADSAGPALVELEHADACELVGPLELTVANGPTPGFWVLVEMAED